MAQFTVNPTRWDPYKNFKFRVKWDGRYVAGIDHVSALVRTTHVVPHREGGEPSIQRVSPGAVAFAPIVLRRGRTHDTAFEDWANQVWRSGHPEAEVALKDFRKDIVIELHNEAGQIVLAWNVYRCWPSEYVGLGEVDAGCNGIAVESLTLQNEGWERDRSIAEPPEPSFGAS